MSRCSFFCQPFLAVRSFRLSSISRQLWRCVCQSLVLLLLSRTALADDVDPFSYVQFGHGQAGFSCGWSESTDVDGSAFAASWRVADDWVVAGSYFSSDARRERCTDMQLSADVRTATLSYLFASSRRVDWFAKLGWIYRDYPDRYRYNETLGEYQRDIYKGSDALLGAGARHSIGRFFEAGWEVGAVNSTDVAPYFSGAIRWRMTERLSLGFQYSVYGVGVAELAARYRF